MEKEIKILYAFEVLAAFTGLWYFKKVKNTYWVFFTFYLVFIVLSEGVGQYLRSIGKINANIHYFNFFVVPVEFLFTFWLFYSGWRQNKGKRLPVVFMAIYLVGWFCDIFYFSKQRYFFYSFSYTLGNLLMLILILRFFLQMVTSDDIITFRHNMQFWVSLGLMIFYLGSFPYWGLVNTMAYKYPLLTHYYAYIVFVMNYMMYLMFTISFIWGKPNI